MASTNNEQSPLLSSDSHHIEHASQDFIAKQVGDANSAAYRIRKFLQWFLSSKYGHYLVITLVSLDVCGIFADFLISLHMCEHAGEDLRVWVNINKALGALSLAFSCLFMVELLCSVYAFGLQYDATMEISYVSSLTCEQLLYLEVSHL